MLQCPSPFLYRCWSNLKFVIHDIFSELSCSAYSCTEWSLNSCSPTHCTAHVFMGGRWKCGSGKCRSRQSMESRKNKILSWLGLAAAVSESAHQQFWTHSHRICEVQTLV